MTPEGHQEESPVITTKHVFLVAVTLIALSALIISPIASGAEQNDYLNVNYDIVEKHDHQEATAPRTMSISTPVQPAASSSEEARTQTLALVIASAFMMTALALAMAYIYYRNLNGEFNPEGSFLDFLVGRLAIIGLLGMITVCGFLFFIAEDAEGGYVDTGASWTAQGPAPLLNGQTEGIAGPAPAGANACAGAIHSVVTHPTNANIIYVGSINGGVWKTTNGTAANPTWVPLTDDFDSLSTSALDMDPSNTNRLVAGFGRFSSGGRDGGSMLGMLLTTNGGSSWTLIGEDDVAGLSFASVAVRGSVILGAANERWTGGAPSTGIWRSTNNGADFTRISGNGAVGNDLPSGDTIYLEGDPGDNDVFYSAVLGANRGLYRSDDAGETWTEISDGGAGTVPSDTLSGSTNNVEFAVHDKGANNVVYVGIMNSGRLAGFFYSTNKGANWTEMDIPFTPEFTKTVADASNTTPITITTTTNHGLGDNMYVSISGVGGNTAANGEWMIDKTGDKTFRLNGSSGNADYTSGGTVQKYHPLQPRLKAGGQGSIHFSIVADPDDPDLVYIGGDRQGAPWPNAVGAVNYSGRLFRGDRSKPFTGGFVSTQWETLTHSGTNNNSSPHADSRDMEFDANGNIIEVDDAGVYRRTSPQSTTGDWYSLNNNLQITEFYRVDYDSRLNTIIGGTQDVGTPLQLTPNDTDDWTDAPNPLMSSGYMQADGGCARIDDSDIDWVYRYFSIQRLGYFHRQKVDAGDGTIDSTTEISLSIGGGQNIKDVDDMAFIQPYELNVVDPTHMIVYTDHIWESANRGDIMTDVDDRVSTIASIAYGGYKGVTPHKDVLYYCDGNDVYLRSAGDGIGAAGVNLPGYPGGTVVDIVMDPDDWQTAYILDSSSRVYRVTDAGDGGETWTNITGNLDEQIGVERTITYVVGTTRDYIVAGGNLGAFACYEDAPGGWLEIDDALPNAPVRELIYDERDDVLLAGTWGRGAWTISDLDSYMSGIDLFIDADDVGGNGINNGNPDHFWLKLNTAGDQLEVRVNGTLSLNLPLDAVDSITINGSSDDDTLIVDNSNGLIATGSWIRFDGEEHGANSGSGDTLEVKGDPGSPVARETYVTGPLNGNGADDGMLILDPDGGMGTGVNYKTGYDSATGDEVIIKFENLSPVLSSTPATQLDIFLTASSADTVNVVDGPTISGFDSTEVNDDGTSSFESIAFANKTTVTVNGMDGMDDITVTNPNTADGLSMLKLYGSELTGGVIESDDNVRDRFYIESLGSGVTLQTYGQGGTDEFNIQNLSNTLDDILGSVIINGGSDGIFAGETLTVTGGTSSKTVTAGAGDKLEINDDGTAVPSSYSLDTDSFDRTGGPSIEFADVEHFRFWTGAANDTVTVVDTIADSYTFLDCETGDDTITVVDTGDQSILYATGMLGDDEVTINGTGNGIVRVNGTQLITVNGTNASAGLLFYGGNTTDDEFRFNGVGANAVVSVDAGGGNDVLKADYSTPGDPISTNGISYDGGPQTAAPGDSVEILGGSFSNITYNFNTLPSDAEGHNGRINLDTDLIIFDGLEPIINHGTAPDMTFYLPNGTGDHAIFEDYGTPGDGLNQIRSDSNTFEDTVFTNPSNTLAVYGYGGNDTFETFSMDTGFGPVQFSLLGGADDDTFQVEATTGTGEYVLYGDIGDDSFFIGSDTKVMDDINTKVVIIGGGGTYDSAELADTNSLIPDSLVTVTSLIVTGLAAGVISYADLDSLYVDTSDGLPATIEIESTQDGTATTVDSGDAGDDVLVGRNGTLNHILGPLTITDIGGGGPADVLTYDDGHDPYSTSYSLSSNGSLTRTGGIAIPPFTVLGIYETVNLLASEAENTIEIDPSFDTTFFIDGDTPTTPLPADVLSIDLTGITDVDFELIPSQMGMFGTLSFGDGHQPISFIHIETFDFMNGVIDLIVREDKSHDGFLTPALPPGQGFADDGSWDEIMIGLDPATGTYFYIVVNSIHQIALTFGDGITEGLAFCRVIGSGDDDTLNVDWGGENPIPPGGIHYDGGSQIGDGGEGDILVLQDGAVGTVEHTYLGPHDGTVGVDGRVITYTGLEPIYDYLVADNRIFNFGSTNDEVFQVDNVVPGMNTLSSTASSETTHYANPVVTMTVNLGDGDDVLTIGEDDPGLIPGFDPSFTASLTINGEGDWDIINVKGPVGTPPPPPVENTNQKLDSIAFNVQLANLYQPMFSTAISGTCLFANIWFPGLIQNGIDVAHPTAGCLITVYPGTYPENLTNRKPDIHLQSDAGMYLTTISADSGAILTLAPGTSGFTLGGWSETGFTLLSTGAVAKGVTGTDLVDLTITHNHFLGPGMSYGINIIGVTASDPEGDDSLIRKNIFDDIGTAIAIFTGSGVTDLTITMNCIFNSLAHGMIFGKSGDGNMKVVVITENTISSSGIGISIMAGDGMLADFFVIKLNNFIGNNIGLLNETTVLVTAKRNYWGAVDGPYAEDNVHGVPGPGSGGSGNPIKDYVLADPWLTIIHHPSPCDLTIILRVGWNLISITVGLDDLNGAYTASIFAAEINSQAGENIIKYIVAYDNSTGVFEEYVVDSDIGNDFSMEYGRAYYVYSTSPFQTVFHVVGDCPVYETFDLTECWNLIGWMSMQTMNVGDFADIIDHHVGWYVVQAIVKYNDDYEDGENEYIAWYPGMPVDEFQMTPGEAYWVFSATVLTEVAYP